ncbi:MAG: hypothetical protein ACI4NA_04875, partial [Succinivibrio sp.]
SLDPSMILCDALATDGGEMRIWRDGRGMPIACAVEGGPDLGAGDASALASRVRDSLARPCAISGAGHEGAFMAEGFEGMRFAALKAAEVSDLPKKLRKKAADPDAPWRSSQSAKAGIPPYESRLGGPIFQGFEDDAQRIVAVFSPTLRESMLRERAALFAGSGDDSDPKAARYYGYVAASTPESSEALSDEKAAGCLCQRIEDRALYSLMPRFCPLCLKIASSCTPSERALLAASAGYLADLALSEVAGAASSKLGRRVLRTEAAAALRAMDATTVGECISGIFERTALTDAIEESFRIFLDSELITKAEIAFFLKGRASAGKA